MISLRALARAMQGGIAARAQVLDEVRIAAGEKMIRTEQKLILARHLVDEMEDAADANESARLEREEEAEERRIADMAAMMARRQAKRS